MSETLVSNILRKLNYHDYLNMIFLFSKLNLFKILKRLQDDVVLGLSTISHLSIIVQINNVIISFIQTK